VSARAWIDDRLKAATHSAPPAIAPPVGAPHPNGASAMAAAPADWEATRPLPLDDNDFERLVTGLRTFVASAEPGASLTLRAHLSPSQSESDIS
jgi:hypothetical protein